MLNTVHFMLQKHLSVNQTLIVSFLKIYFIYKYSKIEIKILGGKWYFMS